MSASPGKAVLFPRPLSLPLAIVPARVHSTVIVTVLNRVFARSLRDGELDCLQGRSVRILVRDLRLGFCITLQQGRLAASGVKMMPDLTISGTLHAYLLLAARSEDTDTLFPRPRLRMEGDSELRQAIRHFLDGLDVDSLWLPGQVSGMAQRVLPLYERTFANISGRRTVSP